MKTAEESFAEAAAGNHKIVVLKEWVAATRTLALTDALTEAAELGADKFLWITKDVEWFVRHHLQEFADGLGETLEVERRTVSNEVFRATTDTKTIHILDAHNMNPDELKGFEPVVTYWDCLPTSTQWKHLQRGSKFHRLAYQRGSDAHFKKLLKGDVVTVLGSSIHG